MNKSKIRVLTTLNHEEPDQVPIFIAGIDSEDVIKNLNKSGKSLGSVGDYLKKVQYIPFWRNLVKWISHTKLFIKAGLLNLIKLYKKVGIDLITVPMTLLITGGGKFGIKLPDDPKNKLNYVDEYGRIFKFIETPDKIKIAYYVGGYFDSNDLNEAMEKFENFIDKFDPEHPVRRRMYKTALEIAKDDIYVVPSSVGVLEPAWESFGFNTFVKLIFKEKDFMKKVFQKLGNIAKHVLEIACSEFGAELVWIWDDQAHKTGPFLTLEQFRTFVLPELKKICDMVHQYNAKLILHTDGNIYKLIDDLINVAKIDGLNPWEPASSMDIIEGKKKWGDKITLVGNVDPIKYLAHGTPEMVEERVKELIKYCAPGGGYILSSGHSIHPAVKYENFIAMINAAKKYGKYPLLL